MQRPGMQRFSLRDQPWLIPVLALVIVFELLVGLVAASVLTRPSDTGLGTAGAVATRPADPRPAPDLPPQTAGAEPGEPLSNAELTPLRELLDTQAAALLGRDRGVFLAGVDPASPDFVSRRAGLFDNLAGVPIADWSYEIDADSALATTDPRFGRYDAQVRGIEVVVSYQLADVDPEPTQRRQALTVVQRDGSWLLASDSDYDDLGAPSWHGLWDFGPVVTLRGESSMVLTHPDNVARLDGFTDAVDQAIGSVTAVWGQDWTQRVAVLVPDTQEEMADVVGTSLVLDQLAALAVSDSIDLHAGTARGQRIVINPNNLDALQPLSRQIVLTHEITHIASRATTSPATPIWLVEGFADYVGFLDSGVSVRRAAPELAGEVQAGQVPADLPRDTDYVGSNPRLSQTYEMSWLACRLVAERIGQDGLLRFYRAVAGAEDPAEALEPALVAELGLTGAEFVSTWQEYLRVQLS